MSVSSISEQKDSVKAKAENSSLAVEKVDGVVEDSPMYVRFSKPFRFEDETYNGVDLSPMENLTANDMITAQKTMERGGTVSLLPEMSLEYACIFAAKATDMPVEFFQNLPPKEAIKVKNRVTSFFYGES